jgi:hypothetical protein
MVLAELLQEESLRLEDLLFRHLCYSLDVFLVDRGVLKANLGKQGVVRLSKNWLLQIAG